jgi:DNA-binding CsgD family transcriptional regulator
MGTTPGFARVFAKKPGPAVRYARPSEGDALMRSKTTSIPHLLEREPELEALGNALARTREGAGGCLLIEGPAGVGKSRLLASARALAADAGLRVFEARGAVLEHEFAFGVARQLFEYPVSAASDDEREELLAGAAGLAGRVVGQAGPEVMAQSGETAFGALHGLYWLTANFADAGPLVLAVDDAHWADGPSLQFLGYLSRRLEGLPVLLLAAGRAPDPEGENLWRELASDPEAEVLRPHALSESAAAQVLRDRLGADVATEFSAACHRATGGNPLFLRELVSALQEAEIAPTSDAAETVTTVGPPAVGRFVLHRLQRLGPQATELARSVSVLGGDADTPLAARGAGLEPEEAQPIADLLVQAEVFAPEQELGFAHPIVRAAIYEDLLPGDRAARHLAAARLLHENGAPAERVATHLLKSPPTGDGRWVAALRAAAASAAERGAPTAAIAYLRRALDEPPAEGERAAVLADLGRWEVARLEYERAEEHLAEALALPGDPAVHAQAAIWLSRGSIMQGHAEWAASALDALSDQLDRAEGELALELEAEALTLTRLELSLRSLVPERLDAFRRRAVSSTRFEPIARIHAATERLAQGAPAAEVAEEIMSALQGGPPGDPFAFIGVVDTLTRTERYDTAAPLIDMALGAARATGRVGQVAVLHTHRAMLALGRGAVADAYLDVQLALELVPEWGLYLRHALAVAMQVALERGELDVAQELASREAERMERERLFVDRYLASRGRVRTAAGDPRAGLADLLRCGELLEAYGTPDLTRWRPDAVAALVELGEEERAQELARAEIASARAFGAPRALARALRAGGGAIGGDEGLELLEEAVAVAEQSPARLEAAYALADLGDELMQRRRRREGRDALRRALELANECGATALAERARGAVGAGGGRPPRLELTGVDALTPAERRVCELAAGERTNREIAQQLFVTEKTVELHLTNAYRKLGIRSRFQLASALGA